MKVKLPFLLFFLAFNFCFSQTEKVIFGKVVSSGISLQNVHVINKNTEKSSITNYNGDFTINAKIGDSIIFYKKDYFLLGIRVTVNTLNNNAFSIALIKKAEELEEVIIAKTSNINLKFDTNYENIKRDEITADRAERRLKNPGVADLSIDKGLNLLRIGKTLFGLLAKEKTAVKTTEIDFKENVKNSCDEKFFTKTLKLNSFEIDLFLQFCETDPNANTVAVNENVLTLMDFLVKKNVEFKKL